MLPTRLFDFPYYQLEQFPKEDSVCTKVNGQWIKTSTKEFVEKANLVSKGLLKMGIKPADKIALITTNNRTEWFIMDIGILQIGAIDVPLYPTAAETDWEFIINDSECKLCFVSDEALFQKISKIRSKCPTLREVFSFDKIAGAKNWLEVLEVGKTGDQKEVDKLKEQVKGDNLATLIYTSGTTGTPKGVMLSHANIASNANDCIPRLPVGSNARALSFLPVCHIYERMILYLYMVSGTSIYFAENMEAIGENLKELKPDVFTAVPRMLEKVFDRISSKAAELTGTKRKLFDWAIKLALQYEPYGAKGFGYEFKRKIANALIYKKIRMNAGLVNAKAIASGAAALQPRLSRFFNAAGIPVMEGYGLTETSPVVAVNEFKNKGMMFGTVGRVINNVQLKIDKDPTRDDKEEGEILVKGPNVMLGYYKRPDATAEMIDKDGWLHTGDIGKIVGDGFLKITDRKKEIFKTAGGKYIAPQQMENKFKESPFVEQVMVIGEYRKHPAALVVPSFEKLKKWCAENNIQWNSDKEMVNDQRIKDKLWDEINRFNSGFGHWEQVKKIELLGTPFAIDTGELTPTLKLKRKKILERHKELVERIYSE